jgi:hypothetical protein
MTRPAKPLKRKYRLGNVHTAREVQYIPAATKRAQRAQPRRTAQ